MNEPNEAQQPQTLLQALKTLFNFIFALFAQVTIITYLGLYFEPVSIVLLYLLGQPSTCYELKLCSLWKDFSTDPALLIKLCLYLLADLNALRSIRPPPIVQVCIWCTFGILVLEALILALGHTALGQSMRLIDLVEDMMAWWLQMSEQRGLGYAMMMMNGSFQS